MYSMIRDEAGKHRGQNLKGKLQMILLSRKFREWALVLDRLDHFIVQQLISLTRDLGKVTFFFRTQFPHSTK